MTERDKAAMKELVDNWNLVTKRIKDKYPNMDDKTVGKITGEIISESLGLDKAITRRGR